ncbi:unnamed protein product, partial [Ixodes hexagonus]
MPHLLDSRYAWFMALTCGWIQVWTAIVYRGSGVLLVGLVAEFNVTRKDASWPFELYNTVGAVQSFTTGILIDFFDTRTLTMAGCLLATLSAIVCFAWNHLTVYLIFVGFGLGTAAGITVPVNVVALSRYFEFHRTSANGLNFAGASIGSILMPPLLAWLLDQYGLGGTMLIIAALLLNTMVGGIVLRSSVDYPQKRDLKLSRDTDVTTGNDPIGRGPPRCELFSTEFLLCESGIFSSSFVKLPEVQASQLQSSRRGIAPLFWKPVFYTLMVTGMVYSFVFSTYLITIVDHIQGVVGVTSERASLMVSVMAVGDLISRLGTGCLTDHGYVDCETLLVVNFTVMGACYVLLAHMSSILQFGLVAFAFGLNNGGPIIMMPSLLSDHLGHQHLPMTFGIHRLVMTVGTLVRPSLIGYFKDMRGSYNGLYYLISVFSATVAFLWVVVVAKSYAKRSHRRRDF